MLTNTNKFKTLLTSKKTELENRLNRLQVEAVALDKNSKEAAIELESEEVAEELDREARLELSQIELALERIEAGQYGNCLQCSEPIPVKRLEALPFALSCLECAK